MKIGEYLRQIRKDKGYSQQEIAERINMDQKSVSIHEKKESLPIDILEKYSKVYDVDMQKFLEVAGEKYIRPNKNDIVNKIIDSLIESKIIVPGKELDENTKEIILAAVKTIIDNKLKGRED